MCAIEGTWKHGQIVLDRTAEWPEGCRLIVEPVRSEQTFGLREEDWVDSPEAIAEWLRWYDSLELLEFTPQEEADWRTWRHKFP